MTKEFTKSVFSQQPIQTYNFFPDVTICKDCPCTEDKGKQANFGHTILTLQNFLANFQPKVPVYEVVCQTIAMMKLNVDIQCFFHEVTENEAGIVVKEGYSLS